MGISTEAESSQVRMVPRMGHCFSWLVHTYACRHLLLSRHTCLTADLGSILASRLLCVCISSGILFKFSVSKSLFCSGMPSTSSEGQKVILNLQTALTHIYFLFMAYSLKSILEFITARGSKYDPDLSFPTSEQAFPLFVNSVWIHNPSFLMH